jgi:hypothetical protein
MEHKKISAGYGEMYIALCLPNYAGLKMFPCHEIFQDVNAH